MAARLWPVALPLLAANNRSAETALAYAVADIAAGQCASNSILSALLLRSTTGRGSAIDVSMLESLAEWMGYPMYYAFDGAPPPPRAPRW